MLDRVRERWEARQAKRLLHKVSRNKVANAAVEQTINQAAVERAGVYAPEIAKHMRAVEHQARRKAKAKARNRAANKQARAARRANR